MATLKTINRGQLKRGDTACFVYRFTAPSAEYSWGNTTISCALTDVLAPSDNTGAVATRLNQILTVDSADNSASYTFQLTIAEANTLVVGATYKDECQLKQDGAYVTTPVTGSVQIVQDYVI